MSNRPMLENQAEITQQKKQVLVQQMNQLDHQNTTVTQKTPQVKKLLLLKISYFIFDTHIVKFRLYLACLRLDRMSYCTLSPALITYQW